jgi:hypothetical protein
MRRETGRAAFSFPDLRALPGVNSGQRGFALVITVVLLALLVLIVYALSALSRVGADIAASDAYQAQARQNALLGLNQAVGGLERYAAEDEVITGMAGIAGVAEGTSQPARQWCGVWDRNARFYRWLASGETGGQILPVLTGPDSLALVAAGSVGADGIDREHVRALQMPVIVNTRDRAAVRLGSYAWWVGDEGVKLSAVLPDEKHAIDEFVALSPTALGLQNVVSYEQISLLPGSVTAAVLAGQLRTSFHQLGRTHLTATYHPAVPGLLNVNSTSQRYWRGVAATYNRLKPASAPTIGVPGFAAWMHDHITMADPGAAKAANGPYPSVDLFLNSEALAGAVAQNGGSLLKFGDVMRPWLSVRSDTFRVRAYGDAVNPADVTRTESVAWCEAIVQRIKDDPTATRGRFVVIYFRWLGPDDI